MTGSGATSDAAIEVADGDTANDPIIREEDDEEEGFLSTLGDIPSLSGSDEEDIENGNRKRRRGSTDGLFVQPGSKRKKAKNGVAQEEGDDKKKLAMDVSYDGFAIWGRVLCLIVKKRETQGGKNKEKEVGGGKAVMENWIASTQAPAGEEDGQP